MSKRFKIYLSMCLGDPNNPVAKNKPFMSIYSDEIESRIDELQTFMTKNEIKNLLEIRENVTKV